MTPIESAAFNTFLSKSAFCSILSKSLLIRTNALPFHIDTWTFYKTSIF